MNRTFDLELQTFAKFEVLEKKLRARDPCRMKRLNFARRPCFFVSSPSARL